MDRSIENVGRRLRALRQSRGVSLSELARETDYTAGYLSQVESGASIPSISALATLAAALGSSITAFFGPETTEKVRVSRAGDPQKLRMAPNAAEEYVVFSHRGPDAAFSALIHHLYPAAEVVRHRHPGERFALMLSGSGRLTMIDGEGHELQPGDAVHYSSHPEHQLQVTSNGPAEILWFVSPPVV
jgi:transcriptional regulator with XRE-family HTH domain